MGKIPFALQIQKLKRRFTELNPEVSTRHIDWKKELGKRETFDENLETLMQEYPQYTWEPTEKITARTYEKQIVSGLEGEASAYGYTLIKKYILDKLEMGSRTRDKYKRLLDQCRGLKPVKKKKRKPKKTCPPSEKIKVTFLRCP